MSAGNRKRRRELGLLPDPARCVARTRRGTPCAGKVVQGANVCRMHGGAAPQVQRKAQERIAHASDVAVLQILALMQAPDTPAPVKLAAAKDLLDRASVSGKTTLEVEVPAWRELLDGIVATLPAEGIAAVRPFAEGRDPLVIEAERVSDAERERELAEELARYQAAPHDEDWSDDFAYGSEPPRPAPAQEPTKPVRNGADRPPPTHPVPERRRIEPDDPDYWVVPRTYRPTTPPPRKGRIAGRRR